MALDAGPALRAPLLILAFIALFTGVFAGLARLGAYAPGFASALSAWHGVLMTGGFFGVVISLERAIAVGSSWAYLAPLCAGLGTLALLAGAPQVASWLMLASSAILLVATLDVLRRQRALFTLTLAVAAIAWLIANVFWIAGAAMIRIGAWAFAFLILTIAGERLELSRFLPRSATAEVMFATIVAAMLAGLVGLDRGWGPRLLGATLVALAAWLVKQDLARRTVRSHGLVRFIAVCLLSGYAWLAIGGAVVLIAGMAPGTAAYDAAMHALGLGFVFSMVFGHAPIIFPAVLRVSVPFHAVFYGPLLLLHVSLVMRVAGDAVGSLAWTRAGAWLHTAALLAFIVSTATAVVRGSRRPYCASPK